MLDLKLLMFILVLVVSSSRGKYVRVGRVNLVANQGRLFCCLGCFVSSAASKPRTHLIIFLFLASLCIVEYYFLSVFLACRSSPACIRPKLEKASTIECNKGQYHNYHSWQVDWWDAVWCYSHVNAAAHLLIKSLSTYGFYNIHGSRWRDLFI